VRRAQARQQRGRLVAARPLVITPTAAAARPRAARVGGVVEQAE